MWCGDHVRILRCKHTLLGKSRPSKSRLCSLIKTAEVKWWLEEGSLRFLAQFLPPHSASRKLVRYFQRVARVTNIFLLMSHLSSEILREDQCLMIFNTTEKPRTEIKINQWIIHCSSQHETNIPFQNHLHYRLLWDLLKLAYSYFPHAYALPVLFLFSTCCS